MYDIKMLKAKKLAELIEIAEQIGLKHTKGMKKQDLIYLFSKKKMSQEMAYLLTCVTKLWEI